MKLTLLIIFFPLISFGQIFQLVEPDVNRLKDDYDKFNFRDEPIYLYLVSHYDSSGSKTAIKKFEFPDYSICSFNQNFQNHISYSIDQCREAKGVSVTLTFPKAGRQNVRKWIEQIHKVTEAGDIEHGWNDDKTEFGPVDQGAGCYYMINETEISTIVKNYCGC